MSRLVVAGYVCVVVMLAGCGGSGRLSASDYKAKLASLNKEVDTAELERENASHKAQLQKDLREAAHRRRLDLIGFSVLVLILLIGFVCGILPSAWIGDQKWAQSIASAVLGLLIGRYTMQKKG